MCAVINNPNCKSPSPNRLSLILIHPELLSGLKTFLFTEKNADGIQLFPVTINPVSPISHPTKNCFSKAVQVGSRIHGNSILVFFLYRNTRITIFESVLSNKFRKALVAKRNVQNEHSEPKSD